MAESTDVGAGGERAGHDLASWNGADQTYVAVSAPDRSWRNRTDEAYRSLRNPFSYYQDLIHELRRIRDLEVVPLYELQGATARSISLRHDIDADPEAALRAARFLARYGLYGSFFLLHTAAYYGRLDRGVFVRNAELTDWIRGFIVSGCELGLHLDALEVYLNWGLDGTEALRQELLFLRSQGAVIQGTVGHNSVPAYGADNSELFAGRVLWERELRSKRGEVVPLGSVSEGELGLSYEGSFMTPKPAVDREAIRSYVGGIADASVRSERWMRTYLLENPCCDWDVDLQFWLVGRDEWVVAGNFEGRQTFEFLVNLKRVIQLLRNLPSRTRSVIVVHPLYVGG